MVRVWSIPNRFQSSWNNWASNWRPWSVWLSLGTPKRQLNWSIKVEAIVFAVIDFRGKLSVLLWNNRTRRIYYQRSLREGVLSNPFGHAPWACLQYRASVGLLRVLWHFPSLAYMTGVTFIYDVLFVAYPIESTPNTGYSFVSSQVPGTDVVM